jgi:hypothetical protein
VRARFEGSFEGGWSCRLSLLSLCIASCRWMGTANGCLRMTRSLTGETKRGRSLPQAQIYVNIYVIYVFFVSKVHDGDNVHRSFYSVFYDFLAREHGKVAPALRDINHFTNCSKKWIHHRLLGNNSIQGFRTVGFPFPNIPSQGTTDFRKTTAIRVSNRCTTPTLNTKFERGIRQLLLLAPTKYF